MAFRPNKSFRSIIDDLGLSTGLQLCLDAGDLASYPGSGQKWFDRAQGYNFRRGATSGVAADDPTFVGVAGDLKDSTYWAFDGVQYFTYDTTNEPWMEDLHKDGAIFSFAGWLFVEAPGTNNGILGTRGAIAGNTGVTLFAAPTDVLTWSVSNAGVSVLTYTTTMAAATGAWHFVGLSINEPAGTGIILLDGTEEAFASTYVLPAAGNATFTMQLGSRGNADNPLGDTWRMGFMAMWSGRALSSAELMSLYQYPGVSFTSDASPRSRNVVVGY